LRVVADRRKTKFARCTGIASRPKYLGSLCHSRTAKKYDSAVLKALGDETNPADSETWTSPIIAIAQP